MTTNQTTTPKDVINLLRDLVLSYTRHHEYVKTEGRDMGSAIVLAVKANRDDHPKLVGTGGKHIWALQTIFAAIGAKMRRRINLTLLDPTEGEKGPPATFKVNPHWQPEPMLELLTRVLDATMPVPYSMQHGTLMELTSIQVRPCVWEDIFEKGGLANAIHAIFHAIGKTQGQNVTIEFTKAETPASAA